MVILAHPVGGLATSVSPRKNFVAPEVLERGNGRIDTKSDIWMLGCTVSASVWLLLILFNSYYYHFQIYLLLTGTPLFSDTYITSPIATAKETLGKLENLLTQSGTIAKEDLSSTASFLRSCLAIKPTDRASALDILWGGRVLWNLTLWASEQGRISDIADSDLNIKADQIRDTSKKDPVPPI